MKIKLLEDFIIKHAHEIIYFVQEFPSYIIDGVGIIKYYHPVSRKFIFSKQLPILRHARRLPCWQPADIAVTVEPRSFCPDSPS